jgi:NAD(P)H-flavin reductase
MVAGGTGASFIVSLLQNLARDSRCCRRVGLVWVVKDVSHLSWFQDELSTSMKRAECQFLDLHVAVYSTGQQEWSEEDIRLLDVSEKDCHCSYAESNNKEKHAPHGSDSSQEITLETTLLPLTQPSTTIRPCECGAHQPRLQLLKGRPDLRQIVLQHLVQDDRQGETGIFVCGPDGLTRDMRSAVVRASDLLAVKKGSGREAVYLHVENQV